MFALEPENVYDGFIYQVKFLLDLPPGGRR